MANRVTVNGIMRIFFSMVIKLSLQKEWYFPGISNITLIPQYFFL